MINKNQQILIRQFPSFALLKNIISKTHFLMNRSDRRLKTIESQQLKKQPHVQMIPPQTKKTKKQSTHKISLKQSTLKQHRDIYVPQLHPKSQKSQTINVDNDHKYKIIKELQILTRPEEEHKKGQKYSNLSKNNKSLIFSEHKFPNPHQSSTLKASKVFPSETKAGSTATKKKESHTYKKGSQKGSTTKKHSKSVYNYTELDDYPEMKQSKNKKTITKESQVNHSRQYHNKSSLTQQAHQISTSSITKRVNKSKDILNKLLNNADIKKKTSHFKILSNCLRSYVKDEELLDNRVDVGQIIKLVKAFNKVEISKMSKPLEELISQMIELIQQNVHKDNLRTEQQRPSIHKYETPQRANQKQKNVRSSTKNKPKSFDIDQKNQNPNDISKTKKIYPQDYNFEKDHIITGDQNYRSSLSKDISRMQEGLHELMSESKQMKKFIYESSNKKSSKHDTLQQSAEKKMEIDKLRHILQKQKLILQKIDAYSHTQKDKYSSEESSLKYEPNQEE